LAFLVSVAAAAPPIQGLGRAEGLERAGGLYRAGRYPEAAESYASLAKTSSSVDDATAALVHFNHGDALYRLGQYARAREAFERAAVETRDLALSARAAYNTGNTYYREAEAEVTGGHLEQAAQALAQSLAAYRRALELDPTKREAGTNLEVARTLLKGVRDELVKNAELRQIEREILETLRALVPAQGSLIETTRDGRSTPEAIHRGQSAARVRTSGLIERFDAHRERVDLLPGAGAVSGLYRAARAHVRLAESHQGRALRALEDGDRVAAVAPQRGSLDELEVALDMLSPPPRADSSQQGSGGSQEDRGAGQPTGGGVGEEGTPGAEPRDFPDGPSQGDLPRDVLREEGEMRRTRGAETEPRAPVDRDW
jgi:tetratricopeptide (TPR) repeat protein